MGRKSAATKAGTRFIMPLNCLERDANGTVFFLKKKRLSRTIHHRITIRRRYLDAHPQD